MTSDMFDIGLRAMRRDRAARLRPELFLLDRAFDDCLERLEIIQRKFRSALLLGCASPDWATKLRNICSTVEVVDPGALFAQQAGGRPSTRPELAVEPSTYDLIVTVGILDSVNRLPEALLRLRFALKPGGLLLGAMSGGETLPKLRAAMRAADEADGMAAPHVHPRVDPPGLAGLMTAAGFEMPVVDVDRVDVSYPSLKRLVDDLRKMAGGNLLAERPAAGISRNGLAAAERTFAQAGQNGRTVETFEILHFAGWAADHESSPSDQG